MAQPTAQEILDAIAGSDVSAEDREVLKRIASNPNSAARAAAYTQKADYEAISSQYAALQADAAKAKSYQDWYSQNYPAIKANNDAVIAYRERYGELDGSQPTKPAAAQLTADQVKQQALETFQNNIAPNLENQMVAITDIIWKHTAAGRKSKPDLAAIGEIAKKYGGNLEAAYDEWDKPQREEAAQAAMKADIDKRVEEQLAIRMAAASFPAGADGTGSFGGGGAFTRNREEKYDAHTDLVSTVRQAMQPKQA